MDDDEDLKKIEEVGKKAGKDAARKISKKAAKAIIAAIKKIISLFIKIFGKYLIILILGALIVAAIWYMIQKGNIKSTIQSFKDSISNFLNGSTDSDNQDRRRYR